MPRPAKRKQVAEEKKAPAKKKTKSAKKASPELTKEQLERRKYIRELEARLKKIMTDKTNAKNKIRSLKTEIEEVEKSLVLKQNEENDLEVALRVARADCKHEFDKKTQLCVYCDCGMLPPTTTFTF